MKNMKLYAIAGVVAAAAVGGTFAYYNASQTFSNPFDTSNYGTFAMEEFNPAEGHKWEPGVKVDKKVFATNTGDGEVWVRVNLNEVWSGLKSDVSDLVYGNEALYTNNPTMPSTANQANPEDGWVDADGSVVYKEFTDSIADTVEGLSGKDWYYKGGYFYYTKPLAKNEVTSDLLNSVTLCADTDMGKFDEKSYYKVAAEGIKRTNDDGTINQELVAIDENGTVKEGWVEYTGDMSTEEETNPDGTKKTVVVVTDSNGTKVKIETGDKETVYTYKNKELGANESGYANADYKLNIQVEFVQTDEAAAQEAGWSVDALQDLGFVAASPAPTMASEE